MGPEGGRAKQPYDAKRAEAAVRELLLALGEDPDREGLQETPARVARAYAENFAGLYQSPRDVLTTTFDILEANRAILDELVIVLLEKETILKDEIEEVFKNVKSVKPRPAWTGSDSRKPSAQPPVAIPDSAKEKPKKRAARKKAE